MAPNPTPDDRRLAGKTSLAQFMPELGSIVTPLIPALLKILTMSIDLGPALRDPSLWKHLSADPSTNCSYADTAAATQDGMLGEALDQVRTVLRIDRHVPYKKGDDFSLSTAEQMVADFRQITAITFAVMAALSSVGLLVGGIGVMNIMLVSVTERTQEIGLRKAVGAKKRDIIVQFLLEASVLTGLGGLAGILFGWIISLITRTVFESLPASVPMWASALGIVMSVGVGLFFGIWPAYKAARLDPVEALRHE